MTDPKAPKARWSKNTPSGFSLIELMMVVVILGILATLVITRYEPGVYDQLHAAAEVTASEIAYARSLAVANNSKYRLQFDLAKHRFWLEHSGTNPVLNTLPPSPFREPGDPPTRQTTSLSRFPTIDSSIQLEAVRRVSSGSEQNATSFEFGPLGSLTQPEQAAVWLKAGNGDSRRYIAVRVDPVTGLVSLGSFQVSPPPSPSSSFGGGSSGG